MIHCSNGLGQLIVELGTLGKLLDVHYSPETQGTLGYKVDAAVVGSFSRL